MSDDRPRDNGLLEEAAAWFARMRGPDAEVSRPEFEAWLARGALHRAAYNRASEIFAMGKFLADEKPRTRARLGRNARPLLLAAAGFFLLLLAAAWFSPQIIQAGRKGARGEDRSAGEMAELKAGSQPQSVQLADGSLVRLAADTILDVSFSNAQRRSRLERGFARFEVAHENRPFVVLAGGGSVTAHGTIFEVGLSAERRVSVRLIEGAIEIKVPTGRSGPALVRRLRGRGTVSFMASANTAANDQPMAAPDLERTAADGAVQEARDFNDIRIADLIATANRGLSRPIRLADPQIGEERISGRFRIDDGDLLAERIALLFGLAVDRGPQAIILRRK